MDFGNVLGAVFESFLLIFMIFCDLGYQIDGMGSRASFLGTWGWNSCQIAMPRFAEYHLNNYVFSIFAFADFSQDFGDKKEALGPNFEGFWVPGIAFWWFLRVPLRSLCVSTTFGSHWVSLGHLRDTLGAIRTPW